MDNMALFKDHTCSRHCRFPHREHPEKGMEVCSNTLEQAKGWEIQLLLDEINNNKCEQGH
jgi:hypothetical protein